MTLKHFTKTEQNTSSSQPSMLINMASYNIIFEVEAINLLKLKQGQGIQFTQDQDTGDWYFFVSTTEDAIALKKFTTTKKLYFSNRALCKELGNTYLFTEHKNLIKLTKTPMEYEGLYLYKLLATPQKSDGNYLTHTPILKVKPETTTMYPIPSIVNQPLEVGQPQGML